MFSGEAWAREPTGAEAKKERNSLLPGQENKLPDVPCLARTFALLHGGFEPSTDGHEWIVDLDR